MDPDVETEIRRRAGAMGAYLEGAVDAGRCHPDTAAELWAGHFVPLLALLSGVMDSFTESAAEFMRAAEAVAGTPPAARAPSPN